MKNLHVLQIKQNYYQCVNKEGKSIYVYKYIKWNSLIILFCIHIMCMVFYYKEKGLQRFSSRGLQPGFELYNGIFLVFHLKLSS